MTTTQTVRVAGNIGIDLVLTDAAELVGLGQVRVADVPLRSGERPMLIRCDTPEGILYTRLLVQDLKQDSDGCVRVEMKAIGVGWGRGEYADEYDQSLMWPSLPGPGVVDRLTLVLQPASLDLGGRSWTGFSYGFEFHSDARRIHRLWTHATWEIGGRITGNTVLHQGQCNMPVYRGARDALFTTTCLKTLDRYGDPAGVSYQLAPRGGLLQAFDFQHAPQGALLMYWPRFQSISSVLESPVGCDLLYVIDEHRFELCNSVHIPAKHVLFSAGPIQEHEARDLWWNAREHVYGGIRAAFGVQPTPVLPEVGLKYSTRVHQGGLRMSIAGQEVESREVPFAIADLILPKLAQQGIRRFFPEVMSESDVTQLGLKRKLDAGVHGELHCASVCATHRFLPSEFWGGLDGWRYMADKARALGIELGAWFAPHFSPRAPIFQEHPEYRMIAANGNITGGGYGFHSIIVADWNTGIYQWVLDDLKSWRQEAGLDYIFTDSWANMGLVQMNYAARMRTNFDALGRLYADLQKAGIAALSFEGISPFGYSRMGVMDLRGESAEPIPGVVGQNDLGWWLGEEDMACGIAVLAVGQKRSDESAARIQFRLMANGGHGIFENHYGADYHIPDWWVRLNQVYLQALPHMKTRRLLPDGAGVCWDDGDVQVLWAYREAELAREGAASVMELTASGARCVSRNGMLKTSPGSVYKITSQAAKRTRAGAAPASTTGPDQDRPDPALPDFPRIATRHGDEHDDSP